MINLRESATNLKINIFFWMLLSAYPAAVGITGSAKLTQRVMHVFLLTIVMVLIVLFRKRPQIGRKQFDCVVIYVLLSLAYYGIITLFHSFNLMGSDLIDVVRPIVYLSYFLFPLFFPIKEEHFKKFIGYLFVLCAIQILFSAFIYFKALWPLVNLYKGRMSDDIFLFQFFRWSGTFGYPADFSFFLSLCMYFLFLSMRYKLYNKWRVVAGLMLTAIALVMTLSRGGMATVAVMLAVAAFMYRRGTGLFYYMIIAVGAVLAAYMGAGMLNSDMFNLAYVQELLNEGVEARSATHRVVELKLAWQTMLDNFPFGIGPDRGKIGEVLPVVETMHGHLLIKWGIIGWLMHMVSVVYFGYISYKLWCNHDDGFIAAFGGAMFLLVISVPLVFGFSSAITDRYKVLPFYYVMAGYLVMLASGFGVGSTRSVHAAAKEVL